MKGQDEDACVWGNMLLYINGMQRPLGEFCVDLLRLA